MTKLTQKVRDIAASIKHGQQKSAQEAVLQDLFEDMYKHRKRVYKMNFIRGIFLGAGTAIGGTIVLALIIWLLSVFGNVPVIGDYFRGAQDSIEQSQSSSH